MPQIAAGYSIEGLLEFRDKSDSLLAGERNAAQIVSAPGTVVSSSGDRVSRQPMLNQKGLQLALRGRLALRSRSFGRGAQFRVAAAPVVRRAKRPAIVAVVSLAPVDHSVHRVLILLLLALPAALVATAAGLVAGQASLRRCLAARGRGLGKLFSPGLSSRREARLAAGLGPR